jgi:hypothetical protein
MIKKVKISFLIPILVLLSMALALVASPNGNGKQLSKLISKVSSMVRRLESFSYLDSQRPNLLAASLFSLPSQDIIHALKQTSSEYAIPIVRGVSLNIFGPGTVDLTKPIFLAGVLKDTSSGAGIANKNITISASGFYLGQARTDDNGTFNINITKVLRAGKYQITASFAGAHLLSAASDTILVQVLPATVQIQTIPAIAGIPFQMDGRRFVSGPEGTVSIDIVQAGQYQLDILLDNYKDPTQQIEFGRWALDSYQPSREVNVPSDSVVQVGLNVFHKVSFNFVDLAGYPVDPARIASISIRSIQGDAFNLKPGDTPWLPSSRTARRSLGLQVTDLLYSVNSVIIDGSNVVNSAQQRFFAKADDTWTITLLLYSLQINARDGLFASPIGKSIKVSFPDGQIRNYNLNPSGSIEIHALARGIYHITLVGVKGLGTTAPVALSRNQVVKLNIVTQLDMGVAGIVVFVFALGLILYGRPQLIKNAFRKKSSYSTELKWTGGHEN